MGKFGTQKMQISRWMKIGMNSRQGKLACVRGMANARGLEALTMIYTV